MKQAMILSNLAAKDDDIRCRVLLEETPACSEFLEKIADAMKRGKLLEMSYGNKSLGKHLRPFRIAPLGIKEHQRRLYLLAKHVDEMPDSGENNSWLRSIGKLRVYAIDMIDRLKILDAEFEYPKNFYPSDYFTGYGLTHDNENYDQLVEVKVPADKCELLDKVPIHVSQSKRVLDKDNFIYSFTVNNPQEFCLELLMRCPDAFITTEGYNGHMSIFVYELDKKYLDDELRKEIRMILDD